MRVLFLTGTSFMLASAIREFGLSRDSPLLACGYFEKRVQLWDLTRLGKKSADLVTVFTSGASMLAVTPGGESLIAGSSRNQVLAAYSTQDGRMLWHRKLPKESSRLRYSDFGNRLWCSVNRRADVERIDAATGDTLEIVRGVEEYWEDQRGRVFLVPHRGDVYILRDSLQELRVERLTFALLDWAFGPDSFCLSESGGSVRCIDSSNGRVRWRFEPDSGSHVLRLSYSERAGRYYGILWQYEDGLYRKLVRFSHETGAPEVVCELESWEEALIPTMDQVVTSAGDLIDLGSGSLVARLEFPKMEYPDSV